MIGLTINGSRIAWGEAAKTGELRYKNEADRIEEFFEFLSQNLSGGDENPAHSVTTCILDDSYNLSVTLSEGLQNKGVRVHNVSPGNSLGLAYIKQHKDTPDSALICFNKFLYGTLIFDGDIFSLRNDGWDSIIDQKLILPQFDNKPLSAAEFFNTERIVSAFKEKTGRPLNIHDIVSDYYDTGCQNSHPFYIFHEYFLYIISNINYSFDPTQVIYFGDVFTQCDTEMFDKMWSSPVLKKITSDNPKIRFLRKNIETDAFLTGTCLYPNVLAANTDRPSLP